MELFKIFKKKPKPVDRVAALEARIFAEKPKPKGNSYAFMDYAIINWFSGSPKTLEDTITDNHKDFLELDRKFDALERYLQIEYFKMDEETQVYDWADKTHKEGFRKAPKKYEELKEEKEAAKKAEHECD